MKRLLKILLGLSVGAAIAVLFAPKSGRELRQQLVGGATGRLLPAAPVEFPEPQGERSWEAGPATAVAEPAVAEPAFAAPFIEVPAFAEPEVAAEPEGAAEPEVAAGPEVAAEPEVVAEVISDEVVVIDDAGVAEEVVVEEVVVEAVAAQEGVAVESELPTAATATSEDLRARIDETRAAIEIEIAQPFAPVVAEVAAEEAVVEEDPVQEAVADENAAAGAAAEEPAVEEPLTEGPEYQEPVAVPEPDVVVEAPSEEPRAWEIPHEEETPASEERQAAAPMAEEPVIERSVPEPWASEEPAVEPAPAGADVVADEPGATTASVEPMIEVADEPGAEAPVAHEEPAAREGGSVDQAEMRRRIEETRARLKAKAFDAMMSGESALLSRDSGEKPVPSGEDVKLDVELESSIDESLSQEDF